MDHLEWWVDGLAQQLNVARLQESSRLDEQGHDLIECKETNHAAEDRGRDGEERERDGLGHSCSTMREVACRDLNWASQLDNNHR